VRHKYHRKLTKLLLGSDYNHVHKLLDFPFLWLGKKHRKLFHDPITPVLIGFILKDKKAYDAANLHIFSDLISSELKRKYYKFKKRFK